MTFANVGYALLFFVLVAYPVGWALFDGAKWCAKKARKHDHT